MKRHSVVSFLTSIKEEMEMRERWMVNASNIGGLRAGTKQQVVAKFRLPPRSGSTIGRNCPGQGDSSRGKAVKGDPVPKTGSLGRAILLVEDEAALRTLIAEVLGSDGYSVFSAEDGEQAARMFSRLHSDIVLVLSGVHLPKLGGDRLLKIIRRIDPSVPVVFETGYLDQRLRSSLLRAGASGFIRRPVAPKEILAAIRNVLLDSRVPRRPRSDF